MAYKRKRGNTWTVRKRRRPQKKTYSRRKYKKRAIKMMTYALETKRRYFNEPVQTYSVSTLVGKAKAVYQPFNYFNQITTDNGITGNAIFIQKMHLRGSISGLPISTTGFAGPMIFYIYLIWARDEINTGAVTEGFTEASSTVNTWFNGSTRPSTWFINSSRAKILYRKKIVYNPDANNAFDEVSTLTAGELARAPKQIAFYCSKKINKMHYFKEAASGSVDPGYFGRNGNYYWTICVDQALSYGDVQARVDTTSLVQYKDP